MSEIRHTSKLYGMESTFILNILSMYCYQRYYYRQVRVTSLLLLVLLVNTGKVYVTLGQSDNVNPTPLCYGGGRGSVLEETNASMCQTV